MKLHSQFAWIDELILIQFKYGGNPVACAAVLAVLSVLKTDDLLNHSQQMGKIFNSELNKLKNKHKCIGDVRLVSIF